MPDKAIQDFYAEEFAHCYGCGSLNPEGLQIKSYWDGEEAVCHFTPKPCHSGGVPGFAYGGLIASLIDCHGAATASAAKLREQGYSLGEKNPSALCRSVDQSGLPETDAPGDDPGIACTGQRDQGPEGHRERDPVGCRQDLRERRGALHSASAVVRANRISETD